MRIIRGKFRKRRINPPRSLQARPTTDMAKEALFTILENNFDLSESCVLDLFAGTGNISYEFASRGTRRIMLVENNPRQIRFILDTLHKLDLTEVEVIRSNVFSFLKHAPVSFDIIFADPPYDLKGIESLPELVFDNAFLNPGGWFILEHSRKQNFQHHPNFLFMKRYGQVHFSFFARNREEKDQ